MTAGSRQAARKALDVLTADAGFRALTERIETLQQTQQVLTGRWPTLRLRVLASRDDSLTIATPNAAIAARCRQIEPSMILALRPIHPLLTSIRYRQDPSLARVPVTRPMKKPISAQALAALDDALGGLSAGPLRDAVARMVRVRKPR